VQGSIVAYLKYLFLGFTLVIGHSAFASNSISGTPKYCTKFFSQPLAPHICQETDYTCGPAALRSFLASRGLEVAESHLATQLKTDTVIGTRAVDMVEYLKESGFDAALATALTLKDLKRHVRQGAGIIANIQLDGEAHWVLVVEAFNRELVLMDPWYEFTTYRKVESSEFLKDWWGGEGNSAAIIIKKSKKP
jgi:ABC-type bacteriocin/lantibiotic exporter with double-glycine peptidase domain